MDVGRGDEIGDEMCEMCGALCGSTLTGLEVKSELTEAMTYVYASRVSIRQTYANQFFLLVCTGTECLLQMLLYDWVASGVP